VGLVVGDEDVRIRGDLGAYGVRFDVAGYGVVLFSEL
jgi:hypothetical protein